MAADGGGAHRHRQRGSARGERVGADDVSDGADSFRWPAPPRLSVAARYAAALGATVAALLVELLLRPGSGGAPFAVFFLSVAISAWIGGVGAGLLSTALAALLGNYFFIAPSGVFVLSRNGLAATGVFAATATMIGLLAATVRRHARERDRIVAEVQQAHRAAEQSRLESERANAQLRAIVAGLADGLTAQRPDGELVFANEIGARMCGFPDVASLLAAPVSEVLGRFDILDDQGNPVTRQQLPRTRVLEARAHQSEMLVHVRDRSSGEERWRLLSATPLFDRDGNIELVINTFRDFTDRKRAEDTQRFLSEASRLLGSSLDYEKTLAAVARLAVPRFADWCAVEVRQPGGRTAQIAVEHVDPSKVELARELSRRYPPDPHAATGAPQVFRTGVPELYEEIPAALLEQGAVDAEHLRLIRALELKSAMVVPMTSRRGVIGVITLVSAESRRRYTRDDLDQAMELAARAALAVENATLFGEAQKAVQLRDEFLSIASHELRTPLTALQLQLEGLGRQISREPATPGVERWAARVGKATAQVARLDALIQDLLDVSRISAGRLTLNLEEVDLVVAVREAIEQFSDELSGGRAIAVDAPAALVGRWDRLRVDQVIWNLLSNAIKYGAGQPIAVAVSARAGVAILTVEDHGIGISEADQARIFERFERAVSERHFGGFGLGLWITRQIVEALGGTVSVVSQPSVRTRFIVELPLTAKREPS